MTVDTPQSAARAHVYRPTLRNRTVLIGWLLYALFGGLLYYLLMGLPLLGTAHPRSVVGAVVWAVLFTGFTLWSQVGATSLTVAAWGLAYRRPYAALRVPWRDVERIGVRRWPSPTVWGEGLVLREGGARLPWWGRPWGVGGRFIPLAAFGPNWRAGALGDDLRRYAPWLVAGGGDGA